MQYVHVVLYYCEIYVNIANKYFVESSLECSRCSVVQYTRAALKGDDPSRIR